MIARYDPFMETSFFAFASDLIDEGLDAVLGNVRERAGVGGVTLAAVYHDARDVFPHNPRSKVGYSERGAAFYHTDPRLWKEVRLQPARSRLTDSRDPLADLLSAARERGMRVNAWAVSLHNDRLGFENPDCAPQNVFEDRYLTHLCPSNPDVQAYVRTLVSDLARYRVDAIRAEALHFSNFHHGYHHERYFEELGALGTFLLGICFCEHCKAAAGAEDIDADGVRRSVRDELEAILAADLDPRQPEATIAHAARRVRELHGGCLEAYLRTRTRTVTSLAAEAAEAASEGGSRLTFIGLNGDIRDSEHTLPGWWRTGVDALALTGKGIDLVGTAYEADPTRFRAAVETYQRCVPNRSGLAVILRPMPPDCRSAENLAAKLRVLRELGVATVDFYHYGLCRLRSLDWTRSALIG